MAAIFSQSVSHFEEMRSFAELHEDDADARATNALLLVVNAIGIPVLTRECGEVHMPPSAAVGILSALFHASAKGGASPHALHALESEHRKIVYHITKQELLLVFACDKRQHERCVVSTKMTTRMLETVSAAISMLLGVHSLENLDASEQRLALSKHTEVIDYIVKHFREDVRLLLGRPLQRLGIEHVKSIKSSKLHQGVWLRDGLVAAEYHQHITANNCKLDAIEIAMLTILSERLASRGLTSAREIVRVNCSSSSGGVIAKLMIQNSASSDMTCIGIFSADSSENELREEEHKLRMSGHAEKNRSQSVETASSLPIELLKCSPPAVICFLNPNWKAVWTDYTHQAEINSDFADKETARGVDEVVVWKALCEFVALRLDSLPSASGAPQPMDYKREDEVFALQLLKSNDNHIALTTLHSSIGLNPQLLSFLHHMREPLQFFSISAGSIPLQQIPAIGDALYDHFSNS